MGLILGIIIGLLWGYDAKGVMTLGIQMAAVLVLMPRMVALLMEGLIPISEGARSYIQKRFPGKMSILVWIQRLSLVIQRIWLSPF